jgi:AraC-like DNA-binding protein/mannose-6-phosphate isomerase-like protein (cupin superfamily)
MGGSRVLQGESGAFCPDLIGSGHRSCVAAKVSPGRFGHSSTIKSCKAELWIALRRNDSCKRQEVHSKITGQSTQGSLLYDRSLAGATANRAMRAPTQHFWRDRALPFVELRSTYHSVQSYKPHFHPQLSFGAVLAGQTCASCRGREILLQQGDLVLIAPQVVHSCNPVARQPRSYHMLYLDVAWCLENVAPWRGRSFAAACESLVMIRNHDLFLRYRELAANLASWGACEVDVHLRRLLADVADNNCTAPIVPRVRPLSERIKQALLDNLESPPPLDALARALGCRRETLIRTFRRAFHTTPRAFVNNARIEQAKQRLKLGEPIAQVAADLGFSDQAQLHRAFVNFTASTPGQYRRAAPRAKQVNFRQ